MSLGNNPSKPCVDLLPEKGKLGHYEQLIYPHAKNTAHITKKENNKVNVLNNGDRDVLEYECISLDELFGNESDSEYKFFLYLNEDILDLLIKNAKLSKQQLIKIIFFLSNLYAGKNKKKNKEKRYKNGWTGLDSRILHNIYTSRDWGVMRYILEKFEIIKINDEFYLGKYCKSFKIVKKYKKNFKIALIREKGYLIDKLSNSISDISTIKRNIAANSKNNKKNKETEEIIEFYDEKSEKIKEYTLSVFKTCKFLNDIDNIKFKNEKDKKLNILKAAKFNRGNYSYSRREKTGRLFHPLVMMNKKLRSKIKIDGEDCIELDYGNMQPCVFSLFYNKKRKRSIEEYNSFIKVLETGEFYQYIIDISNDKFDWINCEKPKNEIMKQIMFSVFDPVKYPLLNIFRGYFPILSNRIRAKKWKSYNNFAIEVQKIESDFVINSVLDNLINKGIKAITVHDSIICKKSDSFIVESIMADLFFQKFNFKASIKKS